jgi:hypothetical protein
MQLEHAPAQSFDAIRLSGVVCRALLVTLAASACEPRRHAQPPSTAVTLDAGIPATSRCGNAREYGYTERSSLGPSARDLVAEHGRRRTAALVGDASQLVALGVTSKARPELWTSFEYSAGPIHDQGDCGPGVLIVPVLFTAGLSSGEIWRASATLLAKADGSAAVRFDPTREVPFYLSARLTSGYTDVELTPIGDVKPIRFSTLCGVAVDTFARTAFGAEVAELMALARPARLACAPAHGHRAVPVSPGPFEVRLVEHEGEACRPHPSASPEFGIALNVGAGWADGPLKGRAAFGNQANVAVLRYTVYGKARVSDELAHLLPCAAGDSNVAVSLEGTVRGTSPSRREPGALTFFFSCEDVAVRCTMEQ